MKPERIVTYVTIALLIVFSLIMVKKNQRLNNEVSFITDGYEKKIEVFENRNGVLNQRIEAVRVSEDKQTRLAETYRKELKSLKALHDIKIKNLHAYYAATTVTTGEGSTTLEDLFGLNPDSVQTTIAKGEDSVFFSVWDKWLTMTGTIYDNEINYKYTIVDSISIAHHWEIKGIWPFRRRERLLVDFSSSNPNTYLTSARSFQIIDDKRLRLTLGPYIGYDPFNGISGGVSLQYPLIKIRW